MKERHLLVLVCGIDRRCAVEAGKEFPNLVVGKEGHVNNCRILWPSDAHTEVQKTV